MLRLGSASKIVAPALRVGWLTGPPAVRRRAVERLKQGTDLCGSSLTQAIAAELLADTGWLDAHLDAHPRGRRRPARGAFTAAVADRLPDVTCTTPTGGMFCWLEFPDGASTRRSCCPRALAAGVAFVPGAAFAVHADQTRAARCCYASVDEATLAEAVARLASCVS